jgi:hypothetical protein
LSLDVLFCHVEQVRYTRESSLHASFIDRKAGGISWSISHVALQKHKFAIFVFL